MKIGFSFGRCVRDIVEKKVDIDDVVVIITQTAMTQLDHIDLVVDVYLETDNYLKGLNRIDCIEVAYELWNTHKLHQPRTLGKSFFGLAKIPNDYVWMDLAPTKNLDSPVVQDAWKRYQAILRLVADKIPENVDKLN